MKDKVSIILPVYNSEKTIETTIRSINNQSYKNIELIIINDGSTDESDKICKFYSEKYKNLIKYFYKKNEGVSKARNYGIDKSSGKFICYIDSDDEYDKNFINILVNKIKYTNADLVAYGYVATTNINTKEFGVKKDISFYNTELNKYIETLQSIECFNQVWNKIYQVWNKIYIKAIILNPELSI